MRSGDIDSRYVAKDRMAEGAKAHRSLQKKNRELYEDYRSEVWLSAEYSCNGFDYLLEGRADGIFRREGRYTIDEIKTTVLPWVLSGRTLIMPTGLRLNVMPISLPPECPAGYRRSTDVLQLGDR
jgi:hypothetical protein